VRLHFKRLLVREGRGDGGCWPNVWKGLSKWLLRIKGLDCGIIALGGRANITTN
jgi:hypothetical protein